MDHILGMATRGVSLAIATASEAIAGRKGSDQNTNTGNPDDFDYTTREQDLDEVELSVLGSPQRHPSPPSELATIDEISTEFMSVHVTALPADFQLRPLPKPVILPQRRPRTRKRGFIRAYAPSLSDCAGISERTFLDFVSTWDSASKASPVFDVMNLACFAVGCVPGGIPTAVSTSVGAAVMIAQELQIRYKSNKYLDTLNEGLFKPRGLFAMIMTYKPDMNDEAVLQANVADPTTLALVKYSSDSNSNAKRILRRLRNFSGTTTNDGQIPECAELVYPLLDQAISSQRLSVPGIPVESQQAVQDYLDRRAQDAWISQNRSSKLAQALPPQSKGYVNRFCDPNHPVNSGSIFGLLTGGTFDPIALGRVQRARYAARKAGQPPLTEMETKDAYMGRLVRGRVTGTNSKKIPFLEKIVRKDVLYLVVCNLPTEQERAEIRSMLEKAKRD